MTKKTTDIMLKFRKNNMVKTSSGNLN